MKKQLLFLSLLSIAPAYAFIQIEGGGILLQTTEPVSVHAKLKFHDEVTVKASIENHAQEGLNEVVVINDTAETAEIVFTKELKTKNMSYFQQEVSRSHDLKPGMEQAFNVSIRPESPSFYDINKQDMHAKAVFAINVPSYWKKEVNLTPRLIRTVNEKGRKQPYNLTVLRLSWLIAKERADLEKVKKELRIRQESHLEWGTPMFPMFTQR